METQLSEEQMLAYEFELPCENCEGSGSVWEFTGYYCSRAVSDCCGGCGEDIDCSECDGTGTKYMTMSDIWDAHDSVHTELPEIVEEIISWWDDENTEQIFKKLIKWEQLQ